MSMIHLHQTNTSTPEQYVAGLIDFGPSTPFVYQAGKPDDPATDRLLDRHCYSILNLT